MHKNYLLRYAGGAGGDFLSYLISSDENFYPLKLKYVNDRNKWETESILTTVNADLKKVTTLENCKLQPEAINFLDTQLNNKNVILTTHWRGPSTDFNLPRMVPVNLNFSGNMSYLFYFLWWYKALMVETAKEYAVATVNTYGQYAADTIHARNNFYKFERVGLICGLHNSYDTVNYYFENYKNAPSNKQSYVNFDIDKLYQYPKNHVSSFAKVFNLSGTLDCEVIENYFFTNVKLFNSLLETNYESYSSEKHFLDDLTNLVKKLCPGAYTKTS